MQSNGTYGDTLTLLAIMREYNSQCIVISTSGPDHTAIESNDGMFHKHMGTIVLGHTPDYAGIHYVSIELSASDLQTCVQAVYNIAEEYSHQISPDADAHQFSPDVDAQ